MEAVAVASKSTGPAARTLVPLVGLGSVCLGVAILGAYEFWGSDFARGQGWDHHASAGFTVVELLGLAVALYLWPVGAVLWLAATGAAVANRRVASPVRICVLLALSLAFAGMAAVGSAMAHASLACGVIFCTGSQDPTAKNMMNDFAGLGILSVGLVFFAACLVALTRTVFAAQGAPEDNGDGSQRHLQRQQPAASRRHCVRMLAGAMLAGLLLPALLLLTALLPNTFEKFSPTALSAYMAQSATGAEVPGAWMVTLNWRVSEHVVLKFFPSTLIFYGLLEAIALSAMVAAAFPAVGRVLGKQVFRGVTWGEVGTLGAFLVALLLWAFYWLHDHSFHSGKATLNTPWERVARTWGLTAVLFMSLALLPASKKSLWHGALGISWERGLRMHRVFGAASLVCMLLHVLSYWVRFAQLDGFPNDAFNLFQYYSINGPKSKRPIYDNFTIGLMMLVGYPSLLMMGVTPFLRGRHWELFRYTHYLFLVLIPATLLHGSAAWHFMLGGIAFWLVDSGIRFACVAAPAAELIAIKAHDAEGGCTELELSGVPVEPGQFAWLNVPAISLWEWHPFSISSTPEDGKIRMCVKNMGDGTWTQRLYELARSIDASRTPRIDVQLDGPHGRGADLKGHAGLLLLAGGIGITQVHSTFRALSQLASSKGAPASQLRNIRLVWSGRSAGLFQIFAASIAECLRAEYPEGAPQFSAVCYLTGGGEEEGGEREAISAAGLDVRCGRPAFSELYDAMAAEVGAEAERTLLVEACGPPSFMASASAACDGCHGRVAFKASAFSF